MAKTAKHELSTDELAWIRRLSDEIWDEHEDEIRANLSGHVTRRKYRTEKRKLADGEFKRLKKLIRAHELPCLPGGGTFGFGFSLTVCAHSVPGIEPDALIRITGEHLPGIEAGQQNWSKIWDTFEPFTHSPRNRELLAFYGLEAPRERGYYEY
jgi:hypothetical protein